MIKDTLAHTLRQAVENAAPELGLKAADIPQPDLTRPKQKEHGDWSTNIALVLGSKAGRAPRGVAEAIVRHLDGGDLVARVEVAGPGFVNLFLSDRWVGESLRAILSAGEGFGRGPARDERVQVEFVSANPTGPLHVGTARNAAIGDGIAKVLDEAGYEVEREHYWNDTGTQMELFAESLEARYLQLAGVHADVPEDGYHGEYLVDLARSIRRDLGDAVLEEEPARRRQILREEGHRRLTQAIQGTLERFRVRFDTFKSEASLDESGAVEEVIALLRERGYVYEAEGATWFRSTEFGDDKDRVLVRRTGRPSYFAKDCAYLLDKAARGFHRLIYVWGADHHGDVKRLVGAAEALGIDPGRVQIVLYQLVSLYRGGEPVRMSKRTGDVVTLDELLEEVGVDAARYTLLTRSNDSPLDFDIEQVTRKSLDNPVYYVQYAHARIASLLRVAADQAVEAAPWQGVEFERLTHPSEVELVAALAEFPEVVETAASSLAPHRLTHYAERVAATFHRFYTDCRVVGEEEPVMQARLWLAKTTMQVLARTLSLLGVSSPQSMERIELAST